MSIATSRKGGQKCSPVWPSTATFSQTSFGVERDGLSAKHDQDMTYNNNTTTTQRTHNFPRNPKLKSCNPLVLDCTTLEQGFLDNCSRVQQTAIISPSFSMDDESSTCSSSVSSATFLINNLTSPMSSDGAQSSSSTAHLMHWTYDATVLETSKLIEDCVAMFDSLGVLGYFGISHAKCKEFVHRVQKRYSTSVAFHAFDHAVTVLHVSYLLLKQSATMGENVLSKEDQLATLVAAICHDLEHDGRNNSFHKVANTERGVAYGAVNNIQESHHVTVCHSIMDSLRKGDGMFSQLTVQQYNTLRSTVETAILNTDLARHFELHKACTAVFPTKEELEGGKSNTDNIDSKLLVSYIVHSSDISNGVRDFDLYAKWTRRLSQEFQSQVSEEKKFRLPVTDMMACSQEPQVASREVGFLETFVIPTFELLSQVFPHVTYSISQAQNNVAILKGIQLGNHNKGRLISNSSFQSKKRKL